MAGDRERLAHILRSLDQRDVLGAAYPSAIRSAEGRRRWNHAVLIALAIYHTHEPGMLVGEYSQSCYLLACSIYEQDQTKIRTSTQEELTADLVDAIERQWL